MSFSPEITKDPIKLEDRPRSMDQRAPFDCKAEWMSFCQGSETSFIKLYNHYFQTLYKLGRQFSGDPDLLKDCLQETFIGIRKKRNDLEKVVSVTAYLIKCYRNKIITEQKKSDKRKKKLTEGIHDESFGFQVTPSHEGLLINKQFQQEQIVRIQSSLNKLTGRQRELIYHFYYNGLSYAQIREIMGFSSVRAVRNLMYRSLSELRKHPELRDLGI